MTETPSVASAAEQMGLGNIIKRTFDVFYNSIGQAFLVMLCFMLPGLLITNFASALVPGAAEIAHNGIDPKHIDWNLLLSVLGSGLLVTTIIGLTFFLFGQIMVILLAEKKRLGQQVSFGNLVSEARAAYGRTLPVYILLTLGTILAFLLLAIPGIYVSVIWAFVLPLVVLRPEVKDAFGTSKRLVVGRWWKTFGYLLVIMIIDLLISRIFGAPERFLADTATFPYGLVQAYTNPWTVQGICALLLYSLANMLSIFSLVFTTSSEVVMLSAYEANPVVQE